MHEPFVLYGGRIDPGKGCEELFEYFQAYVKEGGQATLMLMGVKLMPLPEDPHVRFAGTLPDEERLHALEAATVVVVPSPHESLSLLALEAFAVGTPILANERSEVLADHCRRSNAGLYYSDRWEFVEGLKLLLRDEALRKAMGRNGKAYVNRFYRWSTILSKYERLFSRVRGTERDERPERDFTRGDASRDVRAGDASRDSRGMPRGRDGRDGRDNRDARPGGDRRGRDQRRGRDHRGRDGRRRDDRGGRDRGRR